MFLSGSIFLYNISVIFYHKFQYTWLFLSCPSTVFYFGIKFSFWSDKLIHVTSFAAWKCFWMLRCLFLQLSSVSIAIRLQAWQLAFHLLTPWNRVLLGKLIVTQLVKKCSTFYETWVFITVFTRACQFLDPVLHYVTSWILVVAGILSHCHCVQTSFGAHPSHLSGG